MSIFDKDLVQKDISLSSRIYDKITSRISNVVSAINERSNDGVACFTRLTEPGQWGHMDIAREWNDMYMAFLDWVTVAIKTLEQELVTNPIIQDGRVVHIVNIHVYSNYFYNYRPGDSLELRVRTTYGFKSKFSFRESLIDGVEEEFKYNIILDRPKYNPEYYNRLKPWLVI